MKVNIKTYGCSLNQADSEAIAGLLEKEHTIVENQDEADICIINSCTVKSPTENKIMNELKHLKEKNKKVVIAGCLSQTKYGQEKLKDYSFIGTNTINQVNNVVEETLKGNTLQIIKNNQEGKRIDLPKIRKNKVIDIIPINKGCLSACSFCMTKKSRGHLSSYKKEDIKYQMQTAIQQGVKEFWLTSPDTSTWGQDLKLELPNLLNELLTLRGNYKIRLGMGNPDYFMRYTEK